MTIRKIVIVGGGATGWSVASLFAKHFPRNLVNIFVVEERRKDNEYVEIAKSSLHRFHDVIGLHERQCVLHTHASFGLGVWCQDAEKNYMQVEGPYGAPLEGIRFESAYYKSKLLGCSHALEDFSLNAVAARLGRFAHPVNDASSIYSSIQYGLHLDLDAYAEVLKAHSLSLGVESVVSDLVHVNLSANEGEIDSISLENGLVLDADLFIDCSGEESVLLGGALGVASEADSLDEIFDSIAMGYRPLSGDAKPVSELINTEDGYLRITPLKNKEYVSCVYSSRYSSKEKIAKDMALLGVTQLDYSALRCKTKKQYWVKNCVAIGDASTKFYELFVSPLSLVRNAAVRLLDLLVDFDDLTLSSDEYNRRTHQELEGVYELLELYFYCSRSSNSVLKDYFKNHELSAGSRHRLELFACTGRHPQRSNSIFSESEWTSFFVGNEVVPQTCNLDADVYEGKALINYVESIKAAIYKAAERMPFHKEYIARLASNK